MSRKAYRENYEQQPILEIKENEAPLFSNFLFTDKEKHAHKLLLLLISSSNYDRDTKIYDKLNNTSRLIAKEANPEQKKIYYALLLHAQAYSSKNKINEGACLSIASFFAKLCRDECKQKLNEIRKQTEQQRIDDHYHFLHP